MELYFRKHWVPKDFNPPMMRLTKENSRVLLSQRHLCQSITTFRELINQRRLAKLFLELLHETFQYIKSVTKPVPESLTRSIRAQ